MLSSQKVMTYELKILQKMQQIHTLANALGSSHALKSTIANQMMKLDELESLCQILFAQRGWDISELDPFRKWLNRIRFRYQDDPSIAEALIHLYTDETIEISRCCNRWEQRDTSARNLTQKLLDCCATGIRLMQQFL